jgi:hypothetical protein
MARPSVRRSSIPSGKPVGYFAGPAQSGDATPGRHLLSFELSALPDDLRALLADGIGLLHEGDLEEFGPSRFAVLEATIDFEALPKARERIETRANLVRDGDDGRRVVFRELETAGIPLYAHPHQSLPMVGDLLRFGTPRVREFLASLGWPPEAGYNENLDQLSEATPTRVTAGRPSRVIGRSRYRAVAPQD